MASFRTNDYHPSTVEVLAHDEESQRSVLRTERLGHLRTVCWAKGQPNEIGFGAFIMLHYTSNESKVRLYRLQCSKLVGPVYVPAAGRGSLR